MVKKYKKQYPITTHLHQIQPFTRTQFILRVVFFILAGGALGLVVFIVVAFRQFERMYAGHIYPGVRIDSVIFGGKTQKEVEDYFNSKSLPFQKLQFTLRFRDVPLATISGSQINVAYDGKLSALQAYSVGRSGYLLSDIYQKWKGITRGTNLTSVLQMNTDVIDDTLATLSAQINYEPKDALFQFEEGIVKAFRPSEDGRKLDAEKTKQIILTYIKDVAARGEKPIPDYTIEMPVTALKASVTTENSNNLGIRELIGVGRSKFKGSIPGRVHNIELAASRIHGHLIPPGGSLSFNNTLGDVSVATGFQPAYIIKDGRTVLGDGGGVCQVSTTLFRAALDAGFPIDERHAHSYRVSYYEQDSSPGIDATVFAPGYDLKFTNNTSHHVLIQSKFDRANYSLAFEMYGTKDGRVVEISKPVIHSQTPPPPDLYQDDPTITKGVLKQVDWKAWGAKVSFNYKVTRGEEVLTQKTFYSSFQPWQAVFLQGTKEG